MVDTAARNLLAQNFRHLVTGQVTNDEYEEAIYGISTDDIAVRDLVNAIWTLYSDTDQHKLNPASFSSIDYKTFARFILFLKSDQEYKWPGNLLQGLPRLLSTVFTLGIYTHIRDKRFASAGDMNFWPFLNRNDFKQAKKHPKYLNQNTI